MPSVEVVVPFRGGCPHRERALEHTSGRWPWPVTIAPAPPGAWCKAAAVMPAVWSSTADVVAVADADVIAPGVVDAVAAVAAGAPWAVPHRGVFRLTAESTLRAIAGHPLEDLELCERPYLGVLGGGVVVAHRALLDAVPLDPRFTGWGQEDEAWGLALSTLLGPAVRVKRPLWHLWHPPQPRASRARGSAENWQLRKRYVRAHSKPALMEQLVQEAQHALRPVDPHRHDRAS